jgi:hypothetical protein
MRHFERCGAHAMKYQRHWLLALAWTGCFPAFAAVAASITLGPNTPMLVHASEPAPVHRAVDDLRSQRAEGVTAVELSVRLR